MVQALEKKKTLEYIEIHPRFTILVFIVVYVGKSQTTTPPNRGAAAIAQPGAMILEGPWKRVRKHPVYIKMEFYSPHLSSEEIKFTSEFFNRFGKRVDFTVRHSKGFATKLIPPHLTHKLKGHGEICWRVLDITISERGYQILNTHPLLDLQTCTTTNLHTCCSKHMADVGGICN